MMYYRFPNEIPTDHPRPTLPLEVPLFPGWGPRL